MKLYVSGAVGGRVVVMYKGRHGAYQTHPELLLVGRGDASLVYISSAGSDIIVVRFHITKVQTSPQLLRVY